VLYEITRDAALKKCGRTALSGGVTQKVTPAGSSYFAGVATCGKVHLCPCCGAKIRTARAAELQAAGTAWEGRREDDADRGGGLALLTLTMRHYARQALRPLVEHQREAWRRALGQNAGREWRSARRQFGVVGFVRAWEVTHGDNGWHPHWHVLVFLQEPLSPEQGEDLEEVIYRAWAGAVTAVGGYLPSREHGVRLDLSGHGEGGALARYLMKYQDGKAGWTTAAEMTRQDVKGGRGGHRTPFQIVRELSGTPAEIEADVRLWREYEEAARGMRALYWSNGLRKMLGALVELDDRGEAEIAAEEPEGAPVAVIPAEVWHRQVVRHRGRSLDLLRAAEAGGVEAVRALVEGWGLVWDRDVLPPPPLE
jgi:hypothetical protein